MNKYDVLIDKLKTLLVLREEKVSELDKKVVISQEEHYKLLKEKEEIESEIKKLNEIKQILIKDNFNQTIKNFFRAFPAFIVIMILINLFILKFLPVSHLYLIGLIDLFITIFYIIEDYLPSPHTLKILTNYKLPNIEEKLNKLKKNLNNINKKITLKITEEKSYQTQIDKIIQEMEEIKEKLSLIETKKVAVMQNLISTELETKINDTYDADETIRRIRIKEGV